MKIFLIVLLVGLMLGALGVLFAGVFRLTNSTADPAKSNMLMRWRVILQAGALLMFVLLVSLLRG